MTDETVFLAATKIDSPEERASYLDKVCANDPTLRENVESLLHHHALASGFLESPPEDMLATISLGDSDTLQESPEDAIYALLGPTDVPESLGRLGPYEVLGIVGQGGMGVVLRARDTKLDRIVALKVILPSLAASRTGLDRFLYEARAIAAIRNDYVVSIYAIHEEGTAPFLVMEYVEGESLQQRIQRTGPLPVSEIIQIGKDVSLGLAAAHRRGILHRDMKPANILLDAESRRARITDFGLALGVTDSPLNHAVPFAGTPAYMSPEQAKGHACDYKSDLFGLGGVLYAMSTGETPFRGTTSFDTLRRVCEDQPTPVSQANSQIPQSLETIIHQLLDKNSATRLGPADEVARLLSNIQKDSDVVPTTLSAFASPRRHQFLRSRWLVVVPIVLIFLAIIVVVVNRNGRSTRFEVPEGSTVNANAAGEIEITLADSQGSAPKVDRPLVKGPQIMPVEVDESEVLEWEKATLQHKPADQISAITDRLKKLNPEFDGVVASKIERGKILEVEFSSDQVISIAPLRILKDLRSLKCDGRNHDQRSEFADLSPLRGLPLTRLICNYTSVEDLTPLEGMKLDEFSCAFSSIKDLSPLKGMPLRHLSFQNTLVTDLKVVKDMPVLSLNCSVTGVKDLSPLIGCPIKALYIDLTNVPDLSPLSQLPLVTVHWSGYDQKNPAYRAIFDQIPTLKEIDNHSPADFWRNVESK